MLRGLGIGTAIRWFVIAAVALALWQGFNGDIGAIMWAIWGYVEQGSEVVTDIWNSVNSGNR
jgi:hypothetical protein